MFAEKLYLLRKKKGLSQEQLAQQLNVSRQAVSKWENGSSIPESDKLIAISQYFDITLDYLVKDQEEQEITKDSKNEIGFIICITGIISMILWGLISIFSPAGSNHLQESSMIKIDGNGIFLIICIITIITGLTLLLKNKK